MNKGIITRSLITAGFIIGIGMGGFFDGIFFHQILQIHNMLSNKLFPDNLVNVEINMFWDGLFHAFTWLMTLFGIGLLWKAMLNPETPKSTQMLIGSSLVGFGTFNLVEGIIDHQILQLHHVVQRSTGYEQIFWDLSFLASGITLIGIGIFLIYKSFNYLNSED